MTSGDTHSVRSRNLLATAWHLVHGFKGTFWLATLYAFCISIGLAIITLPIHFFGIKVGIPYPADFLMIVLINYFTLPAGLGIYLLALHHANNQPIKASQIFSYYKLPIMGQIFVLTLLFILILISLALIPSWILRGLLIFIFALLATVWIFSTMLVAEQHINFGAAILKATKAVAIHVLKIIGLYILMEILIFIGFCTLCIGFIWIAPLIVNIFAVLYQDLFGNGGAP